MKIVRARFGFRVKSAKPAVQKLGTRQMMISDGLPERPRPAMHHEPEPAILVGLNLHEMIPAPKRGELSLALLSTNGIEDWMAEFIVGDAIRLRNDQASISPAGWHGMAQLSEDLARDPGSIQSSRVNVEGNGQHATSNIGSHRLRVNQVRRGDNHTDANVGSQMDIGHYGNLLHIPGAAEALERLRNLLPHWCREPSPNGGD